MEKLIFHSLIQKKNIIIITEFRNKALHRANLSSSSFHLAGFGLLPSGHTDLWVSLSGSEACEKTLQKQSAPIFLTSQLLLQMPLVVDCLS